MFIRFFADTTGSALSLSALAYMRALMRIAPVRLVSLSGPLAGRWLGYEALFGTPMAGQFINCVATDPSRWTWVQQVPMGQQVDVGKIKDGGELVIAPAASVATGRAELYTAGVRNVLFVLSPPRDKPQLETMRKYDAHVVTAYGTWISPAEDERGTWLAAIGRQPHVIPVPVTGDGIARLREIVSQ